MKEKKRKLEAELEVKYMLQRTLLEDSEHKTNYQFSHVM